VTALAVVIQGHERGIGDIELRAVVCCDDERIVVLGDTDMAEDLSVKARRLLTDDAFYRTFRRDGVHSAEAHSQAMTTGMSYYDVHERMRFDSIEEAEAVRWPFTMAPVLGSPQG
jgi:hypothetical protein